MSSEYSPSLILIDLLWVFAWLFLCGVLVLTLHSGLWMIEQTVEIIRKLISVFRR